MLFQPVDRLGIQVVGRLIEQQHVRLLKQQTAKSYTAALASGERIHDLVFRRAAQGIHCTFEAAVKIPGVGRVDLILQFGLTGDQRIHLVRVFQHFGIAELFVYLFVFF